MFEYLIKKIKKQKFQNKYYSYIYIENFFSKNHFNRLINDQQIAIKAKNDQNLIENIKNMEYEPIAFPGSITNIKDYLYWHKHKHKNHLNINTCSGQGVTFRNKSLKSEFLKSLDNFFKSKKFQTTLINKFNLKSKFNYDYGIQKYLDGYEISPHPDRKDKALTFMININPYHASEKEKIHTDYLEFKDEFKYIAEYWKFNNYSDTCWVPWNWCNTFFTQNKNNTCVIFSPSHNTLHGVKLDYNHLNFQRTQIYGNFWKKKINIKNRPVWSDYVIKEKGNEYNFNIIQRFKKGLLNKKFLLGAKREN